jgi:D-beta-D-heptose 7-phosphate kinase/D-beta-D-heptose 1-phosphate adenosyltransferase
MHEKLYSALERLGRPNVCVVGDMMLDTYVWGRVSRVSPEGPIPVLRIERREHRPGGAGSVAAMLCALGAGTTCIGVVGDDEAARELGRQLQAAGADTSGLITCTDRPTTLKTRYMGYVQSAGRGLQQIVRVDEEVTDPIRPAQVREVIARAQAHFPKADMIVIEDMAKGLCTKELLKELIRLAGKLGKPVLVDPERGEDYSAYRGATCLVPNRFEAEAASGVAMKSLDDWRRAAQKLLVKVSCEAVVIKLDRDGIFYATAAGEEKLIPTPAREVADVTGAGDMVAAVLALAGAGGVPLEQAVELANVAAGIEVTRQGACPVSRDEMLEELQAESAPALRKIKSRQALVQLLAQRRRRGETVAFTNGVFDLLHLGHVELIRFARAQGDCLVVGLNSDRSARELKGPSRPINNEAIRAQTLASLPNVDYVVIFDETSVLPLVQELRPEVLVKGGDYDKKGVVGWEFVESYGGKVLVAPQVKGLSTTELIRRITQNGAKRDRKDT